jgi:hypothetical protein
MQEGVWWADAARLYPDTKHYNTVVTYSSFLDNGDNTWRHSHRVCIALGMITCSCRKSSLNQLSKAMNRLWNIHYMPRSYVTQTYCYLLKQFCRICRFIHACVNMCAYKYNHFLLNQYPHKSTNMYAALHGIIKCSTKHPIFVEDESV